MNDNTVMMKTNLSKKSNETTESERKATAGIEESLLKEAKLAAEAETETCFVKETGDLKAGCRTMEAVRRAMDARLLELGAEKEVLKQQLVAKNTLSNVQNVQNLVDDAASNVHQRPQPPSWPHQCAAYGHAGRIRLHSGTLAEFGSDADAGTAPSEEGTKPADRHIDSLKLDAFAA